MQGIHSEEAIKISALLANPNATHLSPPPLFYINASYVFYCLGGMRPKF